MNIDEISKLLQPWFQVSTWDSDHGADNERFNRALANVFDTIGTEIGYEDIKVAIVQGARKSHQNSSDEKISDVAAEYALRAETIISYLKDTRNR